MSPYNPRQIQAHIDSLARQTNEIRTDLAKFYKRMSTLQEQVLDIAKGLANVAEVVQQIVEVHRNTKHPIKEGGEKEDVRHDSGTDEATGTDEVDKPSAAVVSGEDAK
jgi:phage tail protein X